MGPLVWSVLGTGSAIATSRVVRSVLTSGWRRATGKAPPSNPASASTSWGEAVVWALVSGAIIQLGRMLVTNQAALFYQRSAGHLPKGFQDVT